MKRYIKIPLNPTIRDIAKLSNVSKSTVSRVLNGGSVSSKSKQRVTAAIEALKYKPNEIARSLTLKKSNTICLMLQDIRNPFHAYASWYAERVFRSFGYSSIICNADNDPELEEYCLESMKYRHVDGVMCIGGEKEIENIVHFKLTEDIPFILVDRYVTGIELPTITLDNIYGGYLATSYLLDLGHSKIGIATSNYTQAERLRFEGYSKALKERAVKLNNDWVIVQEEEMWFEGNCIDLEKLIDKDHLPTALFTTNDFKAIQVIRCLWQKGLHVPEDISIIGFDDISISNMLHPSLSTVHQPIEEMITKGAEVLVKIMNKEINENINIQMKPWLVERESTIKNI